MDGPVWLSIGSVITTSVVGIAAVWLAARFAAKQAHVGRIWERKAEAYSAILEALHEMQEWYSAVIDDEISSGGPTDETRAARNADYAAARKLLRRSIARQIWLLPSDVRERVAAMNKVLAARYESWIDDIEAGYGELKKAIADVSLTAQTDLQHRPSSLIIEKR